MSKKQKYTLSDVYVSSIDLDQASFSKTGKSEFIEEVNNHAQMLFRKSILRAQYSSNNNNFDVTSKHVADTIIELKVKPIHDKGYWCANIAITIGGILCGGGASALIAELWTCGAILLSIGIGCLCLGYYILSTKY